MPNQYLGAFGPRPIVMGLCGAGKSIIARVAACLVVTGWVLGDIDATSAPYWVRGCVRWVGIYHLGFLGIVLLTGVLSFCLIRGFTTAYEINSYGIVVMHGFFSPLSRAGFLKRDRNAIPFHLIAEADCSQGLVEAAFDVGCIRVKTIDEGSIFLPYALNPEGISEAINQTVGRRPF